uniref:Unannotated protein n=1 Tax=freshwater metagenome TaxID=449393 RepID=A0A6J7MFW7_9ZZZZ
MHETGSRVAQQCAHVHTGAEVGEAVRNVLGGRATTVRSAPLPIAHALGERPRAPHDEDRHHGVERDLQRPWDSPERLPHDVVLVVPLGELRDDARYNGEQRHEDAKADDQLVGADALGSARGRTGSVRIVRGVRTHDKATLARRHAGTEGAVRGDPRPGQPKDWRSNSRILPARYSSMRLLRAGTCSSTARNSRCGMTSSWLSVSQVTVAVRGP